MLPLTDLGKFQTLKKLIHFTVFRPALNKMSTVRDETTCACMDTHAHTNTTSVSAHMSSQHPNVLNIKVSERTDLFHDISIFIDFVIKAFVKKNALLDYDQM